jgi:hypothetical protein
VEQVLREARHGFAVCGCGEDQSRTAQGLKGGNWILPIAVNVMMRPKLLRETFLFDTASNGCDLKAHPSRELNREVTEPANALNSDEFTGPGL